MSPMTAADELRLQTWLTSEAHGQRTLHNTLALGRQLQRFFCASADLLQDAGAGDKPSNALAAQALVQWGEGTLTLVAWRASSPERRPVHYAAGWHQGPLALYFDHEGLGTEADIHERVTRTLPGAVHGPEAAETIGTVPRRSVDQLVGRLYGRFGPCRFKFFEGLREIGL